MKSTKLILTLSVIIVLTSLILLVITLNKYGVTGFVTTSTDTGTANLSINAQASLRFTEADCNFGGGSVGEDSTYAMAWSNGTTQNTTGGNGVDWKDCTNGLTVRNDGDVELSVAITSSGDKDSFIGGSSPSFKVKSTNTSTCKIAGVVDSYTEFTGSKNICGNLTYSGSGAGGTLQIDFELKIPENAVGTKGTVITATGTSI